MSRGVFIKTCLLLAVSAHARAQYVDFFNSFLQPFPTSKPRNDVTKRPDKHRQTTKQKYQDAIFFETDDFLKQREASRTIDPFSIYTTTNKPRRKSKATTSQHSTTNKPKTVNSNKIINNQNNRNNQEIIRSITNSNNRDNDVDARAVNNGRKIDNYNSNGYDNGNNNYNVYETTKPTNIYGQYYDNNRQSTQRTTQRTDYYGRQTTRFYDNVRTTNRPTNNRQTTKNPLLNRPGVKPAVVDHNRPPITNRPVTQRPGYERPFEPATYRPPLEPRPPVNTRPPFETERPVSAGANEDTEIDIEIGPDEDEMSDAEKRRLYDICEQKCEEYKSMRVRKVVALPLSGAGAGAGSHGAEVNVSSCAPDNVPLIIGGQLARIETFPHMALLGWKYIQSGGYSWKCGGSLVSDQYVLTAGHCTYHDKDYNVVSGPPGAVQLGSSIYNDRSATVARVELVVRHPKYKLRRSYYDVALLKLAVQVTFSETISPACLGVPPAVGEPVVATGWGKTEYGGDSSIQLRSVSIPIWDMNDCREIWGTSLKLPNGPAPDNQVCAGERKGAKDTCQGDSGGPAQVRDGCSWRVVAVTSVGRSCGAPDTPALYARVPRAFVAKQVYTNIKTGRDGNNQYGNSGINGNNNNGNNYNGNGNNWNTGNNYRDTITNQNGNSGVVNTRPVQNNNGQSYNNAGTPNNNQYYGNSPGSSTNNRGELNNNNGNNYDYNNRNNNWAVTSDNNNGYSQNNGNNRNVYKPSNNNGQTTNSYNQNNYGQNVYNNQQSQSVRNTENPSDIRSYGTQTYGYNDNGSTDNGYNRNNGNGYSVYPVVNKPWWSR